MADGDGIVRVMRERQHLLAAVLRREGVPLKGLAAASGVPESSLRSYFPADRNAVPALMPVSVLYALVGVLPDEWLSLLLPDGRRIVAEAEELDHDALADSMHGYLAAKTAAHCPKSPGGREISDCEDAALRTRAAAVTGAGGQGR